jgi:hypothetical protein
VTFTTPITSVRPGWGRSLTVAIGFTRATLLVAGGPGLVDGAPADPVRPYARPRVERTLGRATTRSQPGKPASVARHRPTDPRPEPRARAGAGHDRRRRELVVRTTGRCAATPSAQATRAAPKPSPTKSPRAPAEPPTPNLSLKKNSIYKIDLSGSTSCKAKVRRPKPPLKNSRLAPYIRTLVKCFVQAFREPLAKRGFTLATPKVKTYKGSVKTPCGKLGSRSNPAFYCSGTIYWPVSSDDGREAYTFARLGYVGLAAHEFGHHLQATTGILYEYGLRYNDENRKGRYALSRRLELQAQCFEGVFLSHARKSLKLSSRDRSEIRAWHGFTGDEDPPSSRNPDHGTSRAQLAWLNKGLDGADFGRCNTWSASGKSVK